MPKVMPVWMEVTDNWHYHVLFLSFVVILLLSFQIFQVLFNKFGKDIIWFIFCR